MGITALGCGSDRAPEAAPGLRTVGSGAPSSASPLGARQGPYAGPCIDRPAAAAPIAWLSELAPPLPEGTYPIVELPHAVFHRAVVAVPLEYDAFVDFVSKQWPPAGWLLSQGGEAEPGEAEDTFIRGKSFGAFRARRVYCEDGWSEIVLTIGTSP